MLENVRRQVDDITSKPIMLHYTDHSVAHSDRVLNHAHSIVRKNLETDLRLNEAELLALVASCLLHDIGMQAPNLLGYGVEFKLSDPKDLEDLRANHGNLSAKLVLDSVKAEKGKRPPLGLDQSRKLKHLTGVIAWLCQSHNDGQPDFQKTDQVDGQTLRSGLLLGVLRAADILDKDQSRVDLDNLKRFNIPPESKWHWWKQHYVAKVEISTGKVRFYLKFPESLNSDLRGQFRRSIIRPVKEELERSEKIRFENECHLMMEDPHEEADPSGLIENVPQDLHDYITICMRSEIGSGPSDKFQRRPKVAGGAKLSWIDYWGLSGNPWTDLPVERGDPEFLETAAIGRIFAELDDLLRGSKGDMRLLVGDRGSGKTTLLYSLCRGEGALPGGTRFIDVSDRITTIHKAEELYRLVIGRMIEHIAPNLLETEKGLHPRSVRNAIHDYAGKLLICLDNLDRLVSDEDIRMVREFLSMAQGALQETRRRFVLVIAAPTQWVESLKGDDLGYVGLQNAWHIRPFSNTESRQLMERRLASCGSSVAQIFDDEVVPLLSALSKGNPRHLLQRCESLSRFAAERQIKRITKAFVEQEFKNEVVTRIASLIFELGSSTEYLSEGLARLYAFYQFIERSALGLEEGNRLLRLLLAKGVDADAVGHAYLRAISLIGVRKQTLDHDSGLSSIEWRPEAHVRAFFEEWAKTKFSVADFTSAYAIKPVTPRKLDDAVMTRLQEGIVTGPHASSINEAQRLFDEAMDARLNPVLVVDRSWRSAATLVRAVISKFEPARADLIPNPSYRDHLGRERMNVNLRLVEMDSLVDAIHEVTHEKRFRIRSMAELLLIRSKCKLYLKNPDAFGLNATQQDSESCRGAIRRVFPEFVSILLQ